MKNTKFAYFGGGCFWCTEAFFQLLRGVVNVTPGYAGGKITNPNYYEVSEGNTGHAEIIKIEYDPKKISYEDLLEVFWNVHNPTSLNRQGNDIGTQYRSIILCTDDDQYKEALLSKKQIQNSGQYEGVIVTEIDKLDKFYDAESYHKNYFINHKEEPYCQIVINPKLQKLKEKFSKFLAGNN